MLLNRVQKLQEELLHGLLALGGGRSNGAGGCADGCTGTRVVLVVSLTAGRLSCGWPGGYLLARQKLLHDITHHTVEMNLLRVRLLVRFSTGVDAALAAASALRRLRVDRFSPSASSSE